MFQEFFSRAVTAGLISESQKDNLMDFAKRQPVSSFVASRPPLATENPDELATFAPPVLSPLPPATEPAASRLGVVLESLILGLVMLAIGAWAAGYDAGPLGKGLRMGLASLPLPGTLSGGVPAVQPTTMQMD